jgi:hypothetical protein
LQIIIEKTKQKIEKARNPGGFSRKKDKPDEPEAKKRREDMTEVNLKKQKTIVRRKKNINFYFRMENVNLIPG